MDNNLKGLYNPASWGIFVNGEYDELHHSFVHEFTHHINYISSTFGIHVIIELLEAIENMIDGLECVGGELRGFYGAVDGTTSERKSLGKLSGREVHRIHRWGRVFDGDGHRLHAENIGPHQGF